MYYYFCPHCGYMTNSSCHRPECPYNQQVGNAYIYNTQEDRGWICPKCNRVWSPFIEQCEICNNVSKIPVSNEKDIKEEL